MSENNFVESIWGYYGGSSCPPASGDRPLTLPRWPNNAKLRLPVPAKTPNTGTQLGKTQRGRQSGGIFQLLDQNSLARGH